MKHPLHWSRAKHVIVVATCVLLIGCRNANKPRTQLSSLLRNGQEQMQKGRYRQAIASFEKATSLDPNAPEPYIRLALIYEECLHDPAAALRYYRKYQQLEKDAVKKEEVRGWIAHLEREASRQRDRQPNAMPSHGDSNAAAASRGAVAGASPVAPPSVPTEQTTAYTALQDKLTAALQEIRQLKAQRGPLRKPSDSQQRIQELQSENESLAKSLREARAQALISQQAALQAEKKRDSLRNAYEKKVADLNRKLKAAEAKPRQLQSGTEQNQIAQLLAQLRDSKRQRDLARAEKRSADEQMARLKKSLKTYAATLSSLHKANDELRKENASLRSRLLPRSSRVRYHTVRAGETLKKIAGYRSVYGDSKKWVVIYQANRDKIRDPNRLTPGQTLVIPPG